MKKCLALLILPSLWPNFAHANPDACNRITNENAESSWRVSFITMMNKAVPYFTNGHQHCFINKDISLAQLKDFTFHVFTERRSNGSDISSIYKLKINSETKLEQLIFNSNYDHRQFPSLRVFRPSGKMIGGAGAQSIPWWGHRHQADINKPNNYPYPLVSEDFASGNSGQAALIRTDPQFAEITLRNDGLEPLLKDIPKWRNWWYVKLSGVFSNSVFTFRINDNFPIDNRGWEYDYTPIYSYDQKTWNRFSFSELKETSKENTGIITRTIEINKKFNQDNVWLARFYPYSTYDFDSFYQKLFKIMPQGYLKKETLGQSPILNKPIELITMTNPNVAAANKKRVWVHTRTHSAESGGSYLIEGLMAFLASSTDEAQMAMANLIFHIVPVHNPDGVNNGNYRLNGRSENLETLWLRDPQNPLLLAADAPVENQILNRAMRSLAKQEGDFTLALNLHSSQSQRATRPFFFPHFGPKSLGYSQDEATLWNNSTRFIEMVKHFYGPQLIEPTPEEGGRSFVEKSYPESWWWANFKSKVMAITFETTYDQSGYAPDYIDKDKLRSLGHSVGMAALAYHYPSPMTFSTRAPETTSNADPIIFDEAASKE